MTSVTISRLSASIRTWSQELPCCWSAGLLGSQCLSFFPHEGPGLIDLHLVDLDVLHHLLVEFLGMIADPMGDAKDGVEADATQATGRPHAVALDQMLGDVQDGLLGQLRAKQRSAGSLGEVLTAAGTTQATDTSLFAGPAVRTNVGAAGLTVARAVGVGTGESGPVTFWHNGLLSDVLNSTGYRINTSDGRPMASRPKSVNCPLF